MTNIKINNCNVTNTQVGERNIINVSTSVTEDEWNKLELFFNERLKKVEKEYYFLVKEAENYVKEKDKKGLKNYINRYASEFAAGVFCNVASAGIINLMQKLGIWV